MLKRSDVVRPPPQAPGRLVLRLQLLVKLDLVFAPPSLPLPHRFQLLRHFEEALHQICLTGNNNEEEEGQSLDEQ